MNRESAMSEGTIFSVEIPWVRQGAYLIYAPLADVLFVANRQFTEELEYALAGGTVSTQAMEIVDTIRNQTAFPPLNEDMKFSCLTVLPTNRCNFDCSYCYAAHSRETSRQTISSENLMAGLQLFLSRVPENAPSVAVTFYGGGEPLLAWERIVETLGFMSHHFKEKTYSRLITNGSLLNEDKIAFARECHMELVVSFDILPDIQERQRGHYELVAAKIDKCLESDLVPEINSVITPANVNRMMEMINHAVDKWGRIKYFHFEPVIGRDLFPNHQDYHDFLFSFMENFFNVQKKLRGSDKELSCSFYKKLVKPSWRFCPVDYVITPYGEITSCACVSSPQIEDYDFYLYGKKGKTVLDHERFTRLLTINSAGFPKCRECISRWNCAGGCLFRRRTMGQNYNDEFCCFMREFTIMGLVNKLDSLYSKNYGKSLSELLMVSGMEHQ